MTGPVKQSQAKIKLFGARNLNPASCIRDFLQLSSQEFGLEKAFLKRHYSRFC
jgi:hypothetical protein